MTTYSPVYGMPSPELLVGSADAAAAFTAVGARIDREMTQLRSSTYVTGDIFFSIAPGQAVFIYLTDIPVVVIGWIEIDVHVSMGSAANSLAATSGFVKFQDGGTFYRDLRWRSHNNQTAWDVAGTGTRTVMSGQTTQTLAIALYCDAGALAGVEAYTINVGVRQYGAPASG
jgi:hypothetical protein